MRLLVTGATGYIGSHFTRSVLADPDIEIISLARRSHELFSTDPRFKEISLDLHGLDALQRKVEDASPDVIIHMGAVSTPQEAEDQPEVTNVMNVALTRCLCRAAQVAGASMIFTSTDLVFGGRVAPPGGFVEDDKVSPYSVYSRSKVSGENLVQEIGGTIVRIALAYGPPIGSRAGQLAWMRAKFLAGEPVPLFHDEWRSPCYVGDIVEGLYRLMRARTSGIFHCGGPQRLSRLEFGLRYAQALGVDPKLVKSTSRLDAAGSVVRPQDTSLNSAKLTNTLGIKRTSAEEGARMSITEGA